ncbi:MAG TPA: hypothetical protein VH597_05970 [Verrucomicrobiae bacterium]|jgi:hypothetical protein|nr:hypothetical protein [Verrucomicrobiae bacterium]
MNQEKAEKELNWRLYQWAKESIKKEFAADFPILSKCKHERRILCFLEWMKDIPKDQRIATCLSLVKRNNKHVINDEDVWNSSDSEIEEAYGIAYWRYHETLPPTPNTDRLAPGFAKADLKRARETIAKELESFLGQPSKQPQRSLWYIKTHENWTLKTVLDIRSPYGSGQVECYHFLWRSDFEYDTKPDSLHRKIDPIASMGIWISRFPLLSASHERLSAQSVRAVTEMFVPVFPKIIAGLN